MSLTTLTFCRGGIHRRLFDRIVRNFWKQFLLDSVTPGLGYFWAHFLLDSVHVGQSFFWTKFILDTVPFGSSSFEHCSSCTQFLGTQFLLDLIAFGHSSSWTRFHLEKIFNGISSFWAQFFFGSVSSVHTVPSAFLKNTILLGNSFSWRQFLWGYSSLLYFGISLPGHCNIKIQTGSIF
jgi:hypothetical protein